MSDTDPRPDADGSRGEFTPEPYPTPAPTPPPAAERQTSHQGSTQQTPGSDPRHINQNHNQLPPPQPGAAQPHQPVAPPTRKQPGGFAIGFGKGFGFALGLGVISVAMSILLLLTSLVGLIGSSNNNAQTQPMKTLWGPASASQSFLAINISGAIMTAADSSSFTANTYGYEIADQLDEIEADDYAGVILLMDTPGGTVTGSKAIADAVIRYQERTSKPVIAFVESMSASGGMYSMAPADLIISDYAAMTGSIGVIMGPLTRYNDVIATGSSLIAQGVETTGGIEYEYLSRGTGKDFGNPYRPMSDEERAVYGHGLDVEYDNFVNIVSEHRDIPAQTIVDDLGAHLYDAETAVEKGLVDEILGRPDAFRRAAEFAEIDVEDFNVVSPTIPSRFSQLFGAEARVWGHGIPLSTNDGVRANNEMCTGSATVIAYYGSVSEVCGA